MRIELIDNEWGGSEENGYPSACTCKGADPFLLTFEDGGPEITHPMCGRQLWWSDNGHLGLEMHPVPVMLVMSSQPEYHPNMLLTATVAHGPDAAPPQDVRCGCGTTDGLCHLEVDDGSAVLRHGRCGGIIELGDVHDLVLAKPLVVTYSVERPCGGGTHYSTRFGFYDCDCGAYILLQPEIHLAGAEHDTGTA